MARKKSDNQCKSKACHACNATFSLGDTCPFCGAVAEPGKKGRRIKLKPGVKPRKHLSEDSPWDENNVRTREGD